MPKKLSGPDKTAYKPEISGVNPGETKYTPDQLVALKAKYGDRENGIQNIETDFRTSIRATLVKMLHGNDIEDPYNAIILKIHKAVSEFEGRAAFSTLVFKIIRNEALTEIKTRRLAKNSGSSLDELMTEGMALEDRGGLDPEQITAQMELGGIIMKLIDSLPAEYKSAFTLVAVDGCTNQEAADILGINMDTVKSRVSRAKQMLRKKLKKYQITSSEAIPGK